MQLTDKYGLSAAVARKRAGLPPLHSLSLKSGQESVPGGGGSGGGVQVSLAPCQAKNIEEIEVLPIDELFGDTQVNMTQVCTVQCGLSMTSHGLLGKTPRGLSKMSLFAY